MAASNASLAEKTIPICTAMRPVKKYIQDHMCLINSSIEPNNRNTIQINPISAIKYTPLPLTHII